MGNWGYTRFRGYRDTTTSDTGYKGNRRDTGNTGDTGNKRGYKDTGIQEYRATGLRGYGDRGYGDTGIYE